MSVRPLSYAEGWRYLDQCRRVVSNEATRQEKDDFFREVAQRLSPESAEGHAL